MYCGKCGNELKDGEKFCGVCGAAVEGAPVRRTTAQDGRTGGAAYDRPRVTASSQRGKNGSPAVIAAVAAVILLVLFAVVRTPAWQKPIRTLFSALQNEKAGKMVEAIIPDVKSYYEELGITSDEVDELLEDTFDELDGYTITYKIISSTALDEEELEDIEYYYSRNGMEITAKTGKCVELELTIKYGTQKVSQEVEVNVFKTKGKWYVDMSSISSWLF